MIYFDVSYIARLYLDDPGWEKVRALAAEAPIACSLHGHAEVIAALHRKFREGVFTPVQYRQVLKQFEVDCGQDAYRWLPLSPAISARVEKSYRTLPRTIFLRASDALHLASASENRFREIYSNDRRLLAAANHFSVTGVNII